MKKERNLATKVIKLCSERKPDLEVTNAFNKYQQYIIGKKGYDKRLHHEVLNNYENYKIWFYVKNGGLTNANMQEV